LGVLETARRADEEGFAMNKITFGLIVTLGLASCASSQADRKMPAAPAAPVTPAPKYEPQALDPDLRAKAREELLAGLNDTDPVLRCNCIEALSKVDPTDASAVVMKDLSAQSDMVRFAAVVAAGQMKLVDAYQPLLGMVDDPSPQVQAAVLFALHRLGDTRRSHELEHLAASADPHVRGTVAFVVGLLKEPSAAKMLTTLLADRSPAVRIQAAEALWRIGNQRGLEDLVAFSISGYPDDQMIALPAIAETGDQRVIQHIRGQLDNDYIEVSLSAARALGMLGSDEGWNIAVPAATSSDPRQRSLAALAMGAIGRTDLQPYLKQLIKDKEPAVRISAATAILQLHEPEDVRSLTEN
jgi:HEAT repeat protein